jgi:hypothetical protein
VPTAASKAELSVNISSTSLAEAESIERRLQSSGNPTHGRDCLRSASDTIAL